MKKAKKFFVGVTVVVAAAACMALAACGGSDAATTYTTKLTGSANFATDCYNSGYISSLFDAETSTYTVTLVIEGGKYTYTKELYSDSDLSDRQSGEYSAHSIFNIKYSFIGTCSVDGNEIKLSAPTSVTYMEQWSALSEYGMTENIPETTTTDKGVTTPNSGANVFDFFEGFYWYPNGSGEQTVTVSGSTIVIPEE